MTPTEHILHQQRTDILADIDDASRAIRRAMVRAERSGAPASLVATLREARRAIDAVTVPVADVGPEGLIWRAP